MSIFRAIQPLFDGEPAAGGGAPPAAAPPAPPAEPPPPAPPAAPPAPPFQGDFDPERARSLIDKLRSENNELKKGKVAGEAQLRALAQSLGIELPGTPSDPEVLRQQLEKTRRENTELRVGQALEQASRKHGADTDLLVPFLKGSAALDQMDPSSANFAKDVSDLVKSLLEKNPKLRGAPAVQRTTGDGPGGSSAVEQLTQDQLKGMKPEEINAARLAGKLDKLLGRGA